MKRPTRGGKYGFEYDVGLWTFGSIQVYKDRQQGVLRTCKTVDKNLLRTGGDATLGRMKALQALKHANIASIVEIVEEPTSFFIVSEFCPGGDVDDWVQEVQRQEDNTCIDEATICGYIRQVLLALVHCEQNGVHHGDLRPSSLLLSSKQHDASVKVGDFGLASILDRDGSIRRRNLSPYTAPEVLEGSAQSGVLSDLYSIGAIAHVLLVGQPPADYSAANSGMLAGMSRLLTSRDDDWFERSRASKDFVQTLLQPASERPTAARALQHLWIRSMTPSCPTEIMTDTPSKMVCYMLAVLLLPAMTPYGDFEKLNWGFTNCDTDGDGLAPIAAAHRLLQTRSMSRESASAALEIADVGSTGVVDLCGAAVADLIGREFMGSGPIQAAECTQRLLSRIFQVYGEQRQTVTCAQIRARLRTATWREVERSCGVNYDEILSCFLEGSPIDGQVMTSQLIHYGGMGTPLGGTMQQDQDGESLFGMDGIENVIGDIFKACGLGRSIPNERRTDVDGTRCM